MVTAIYYNHLHCYHLPKQVSKLLIKFLTQLGKTQLFEPPLPLPSVSRPQGGAVWGGSSQGVCEPFGCFPQMSNCIPQQPRPPITLSRTRLGGWSSSWWNAVCWTPRSAVLMAPPASLFCPPSPPGSAVGGAWGTLTSSLCPAEPMCSQNPRVCLSSCGPRPGMCGL